MALLALCVTVVASQPDQSVVADSVRYRKELANWSREADFQRPAMLLRMEDRALYYRIFTLQNKGEWKKADELIANLNDPLLVGHILYQRYLINPSYHSEFSELNSWLKDFGDHPNAERVYQLAQRRHSDTDEDVIKPILVSTAMPLQTKVRNSNVTWMGLEDYVQRRLPGLTKTKQTKEQVAAADKLARQIRSDLSHDHISQALEHFNTNPITPKLTGPQQGVLLTQIAFGYYYNGKYPKARLIAQRAWRMKGQHQLIADWVSGLATWQLEEYSSAEQYFARIVKANQSEAIDPWFSAAGAFWAARAAAKQGNHGARQTYLQEAALYPTTFYGLLAHSALGYQLQPGNDDENNNVMASPQNAIRVLASYPAGERALALLDLDQKLLASSELAQLVAQNQNSVTVQKNVERAVRWVATQYDLKDVEQALAVKRGISPALQAACADDTLFPVMQEAVASSKQVDPALIHALIRQESRFNPKARNRTTGAAGLMQLMPKTASFMGAKKKIDANALMNPAVNLQLGQRYVGYLLRQPHIDNNLFYLAVAYNAGPGNLMNWQRKLSDQNDDPLLFIESIPFSQTRAFVERVMTNYWIYRIRLGQDAPSLKTLTEGEWPLHPTMQSGFNLASVN
ncbi:MAG TPA: lytic transglycosylase domain-containing protein [Alphaproteobacteria bacterium]